MPRDPNIYYNLVKDENSMTELVCNLMRIAAFRRAILGPLLPAENLYETVSFCDVETQVRTPDNGQPDLTIDNEKTYGFIEVKITDDCKLTDNQPGGYLAELRRKRKPNPFLAFLVPPNWGDRGELDARLRELKNDSCYDGIAATVITWEDVLVQIEKDELHTLDFALQDFHRLIEGWFRPKPIKFDRKEIEMLFSKDTLEGLSKLQKLIDSVCAQAQQHGFKVHWDSTERRALVQTWYGFCLGDNDLLYFGMQKQFWELTGSPLCFLVNRDNGPARDRFLQACADRPHQRLDKTWTGIGFEKEVLEGESAAHKVWEQVKPLAEAVLGKKQNA